MRKGVATGLAIVGFGAGIGTAYELGSQSAVEPVAGAAKPGTNPNAGVGGNITAQVDQLCSVDPWGKAAYIGHIGADLVSDLGQKDASGNLIFQGDTAVIAAEAAKALAPNDAAMATVKTIISGESGITPSEVVDDSSKTLEQMVADPDARKKVCVSVIGRVLTTPQIYNFQSRTGKIANYTPQYDTENNLVGLNGTIKPNTAEVKLFGIAAIAGSPNEARDEQTSKNWGITAEGQVIQTVDQEGEVRPSVRGKRVNVKPHKSGIKVSSKTLEKYGSSQKQQAENNGGSSDNQAQKNKGKGQGGGATENKPAVQPGNRDHEKQNGAANGKAKGPKGKGPKGTNNGDHESPSGGGGGSSTTTTGTSTGSKPPTTTTETTPPTITTTETTPPTTTTTDTITTPPTTTTTTTTTTTSTGKDPHTTCDPNIEKCN